MALSELYLNILSALHNNNVEYLVIGGHAVNFHGYVHLTADTDIRINEKEFNLHNAQTCLQGRLKKLLTIYLSKYL